MSLPKRTFATMVDAIALSSPNGRMSKRARAAANARLAKALFGDALTRADIIGSAPQPSERERLLAQAARLRELAGRGMCRRKYSRAAAVLEVQAATLNPGE